METFCKAINPETEWLYAPDYSYVQRTGTALCMQLIFPYRSDMPQQERYPLVLFVPGAAWYRQEMYNSVPQWAKLAEQGMVVATVQVRSSKEAKFPAQTEDILDALKAIVRDAERWHIDPHRVYLAGQSSGGHLALLTLLRNQAALAAIPECTVRGLMAISAPTDMQLCGGKPSLDLLGLNDLAEDTARVEAASARKYITPDAKLPKMLLIHGTADEAVPPVHSQQLYDQLIAAGKDAQLHLISGAGHGGAWCWRGEALEAMAQFVLADFAGNAEISV